MFLVMLLVLSFIKAGSIYCTSQNVLEYEFDLVVSWRSSSEFYSTWLLGQCYRDNLHERDHLYGYPINFRVGLSKTERGKKYRFLQFSRLSEKLHILPFRNKGISLWTSFVEDAEYGVGPASFHEDSKVMTEACYEYSLHNFDCLIYKRFFNTNPLLMLMGGGISLGHYGKKCEAHVKGVNMKVNLQHGNDPTKGRPFILTSSGKADWSTWNSFAPITDDEKYCDMANEDNMRTVNAFVNAQLFYTGFYIFAKGSFALGSCNVYCSYKCSPLANLGYNRYDCLDEDGNSLFKEKIANNRTWKKIVNHTISEDEVYEIFNKSVLPEIWGINTICACGSCLQEIVYGISWNDIVVGNAIVSLGCSGSWLILYMPSVCDISNVVNSPFFKYNGYTISLGISA